MKLSKEEKNEKMDKALKLVQSSTLTKYKIAQDTGISEASIGNYKNGKKRPSFANAEILIRYFEGDMLQKEQPSSSNYQSGGNNINSSYHGNFTKPIHAEINAVSDNGILGDWNFKNSPKLKEIYSDFEADLKAYKLENEYLRKQIESLEKQLEQAIIDKEKAMNMLDKLINK